MGINAEAFFFFLFPKEYREDKALSWCVFIYRFNRSQPNAAQQCFKMQHLN